MSDEILFGGCTVHERSVINRVIDRAIQKVFVPANITVDRVDLAMDLEAAHSLCPLDFEQLLTASNFDFNHDIAGIRHHLNRDTGKLMDYFVPRCALSHCDKFYTSRPEGNGYLHVGRVYVIEDSSARALAPRLDLVNYSPDSERGVFGWGYGGSGAAQLALAILADATDPVIATRLHQHFKSDKIARLPRGTWRITATEVSEWLRDQGYSG